MSTPVEQLLHTWREAERVLDRLAPLTPDHEDIALAVARLRDCYQHLADQRASTADALADAHRAVSEAQALLDRVLGKGELQQ